MDRTHGGDRTGFYLEYGREPLDFSANISPLGLPEGVQRAAGDSLEACAAYPDPQCRALRRALGASLGMPEAFILCGNGASDLIYRLAAALRPQKVLVTAPSFTEYEAAVKLYGSEVRRFPLEKQNGFLLTEAVLGWITPDTDLVLLGQPNNPTGLTVPLPLLEEILRQCQSVGAYLAVDECFLDFLDHPEAFSLLPRLSEGRLLILRAFTKFYGMAGFRLGYSLCGDPELLRRMALAGPPWAVSHVAQQAGIAALSERDYARRLRTMIRNQRPVLAAGLEGCGCQVIPGEANYLLFRHERPDLAETLVQYGILIRDCRDFQSLGPGWYRIAVRKPEENRRLIRTMEEVTG